MTITAATATTAPPSTSIFSETTTSSFATTAPPTVPRMTVDVSIASFRTILEFEGGTATYSTPGVEGSERTAVLSEESASRIDDWIQWALAGPLNAVLNDGRELGAWYWRYSFDGGGVTDFSLSWVPIESPPELAAMHEWVASVWYAMSYCQLHADLTHGDGCGNLLAPGDPVITSVAAASLPRGGVPAGVATESGWRYPTEVSSALSDAVKDALQPVITGDVFDGDVTAQVLAVRGDGSFYAFAEDVTQERVCFVRSVGGDVQGSCSRLLLDVVWVPETGQANHLEFVVRPVGSFSSSSSVRFYRGLGNADPVERAGVVARTAALFELDDAPEWPMTVEVYNEQYEGEMFRVLVVQDQRCTAAGLVPEPTVQEGLPPPVAETRERLYRAAVACNLDAMAQLPRGSNGDLTHAIGHRIDWPDPYDPFAPLDHGQAPGLWPIVQMLDTDFAVITGGTVTDERDLTSPVWRQILDDPTQDVYVWPAADALRSRQAASRSQSAAAASINQAVYGDDGYDDTGRYEGWTIGIRADGTILWVVGHHPSGD